MSSFRRIVGHPAKTSLFLAALAHSMTMGNQAAAAEAKPIFHGSENSSIASSVVVPASCDTVYLSGLVAWNPGEEPPKDLDTEEQTARTIEAIRAELGKHGLDLNDVVMMRTYLVADPKLGKMDFAGYSRAYRRYFLERPVPAKPARATVEVARLAFDEMLVEIEVIAATRCGGK